MRVWERAAKSHTEVRVEDVRRGPRSDRCCLVTRAAFDWKVLAWFVAIRVRRQLSTRTRVVGGQARVARRCLFLGSRSSQLQSMRASLRTPATRTSQDSHACTSLPGQLPTPRPLLCNLRFARAHVLRELSIRRRLIAGPRFPLVLAISSTFRLFLLPVFPSTSTPSCRCSSCRPYTPPCRLAPRPKSHAEAFTVNQPCTVRNFRTPPPRPSPGIAAPNSTPAGKRTSSVRYPYPLLSPHLCPRPRRRFPSHCHRPPPAGASPTNRPSEPVDQRWQSKSVRTSIQPTSSPCSSP
ncbi:hypothetical protein LXA43DRAFT_327875 [Ganoderma leucocontextum]|nr:hypothetical protein LXA43DRAFT_327875 [Ganoderma leucocontextum]